MTDTRYFIGGDNSGHEYLVPLSKKKEWYEWLDIPDDDERSWTEPGYAIRFGGYLTFTNPEIEPPSEKKNG